jgi:tetratricopeptide (TPR) repeat protein
MRHAGRVVSKAELLDAIWSGDVVGESVLARCASCTRKILRDDIKAPRFIRTCHGRGYEFIAPVTERAAETFDASAGDGSAAPSTLESIQPASAARPFIGRAAEALLLKDAFRNAGHQAVGFVLVTGEAGIGKTRLLEEVTRDPLLGVEPHWARCWAHDGAPSFFPWRQIVRSVARQRTPRAVARAFGNECAEARRLLLGGHGGRTALDIGWDSPAERFRVFDAIAVAFAKLARQQPIALVMDDLHAADLASLLLLEFLIRQPAAPILFVGVIRDPEPVADASSEVLSRLRAACSSEILLHGLTREGVRNFVQASIDKPREDVVESLFTRTAGNPFFLSMLATSGADRAGANQLPAAVLQAASQRLSLLEPEGAELLRVAAVCGREFDVLTLSRASGVVSEHCFRLLAHAIAARIVCREAPDQFRFEHDLLREVLYAGLAERERAHAHLAVGRALDTLSEYQDPQRAGMLAHHFIVAAHCGGATRAVDLSIRAGAYALRHFAYEEAIVHFSHARRLLPACESADTATECAILLDLGIAQISAGLREDGRATLHLAASQARDLGAAGTLAGVALSLAPGLFSIETGVYDPVLVGLLREALHNVGPSDERLRALLLARLALAMYWSDTWEERVAICREADDLAVRIGADDVAAAATTARIFALLRPGNLEERRALSRRAIELCRRASDHQGLLINLLIRVAMLMEAGDMAGAAFEADVFRKLAEEMNQPQALWIVRAHEACRLLLDGRLDEVERLAGACLQTGQRVHDHNALLTFGVHLTLLRLEQGRGAEILDVVRDYAAQYPRIIGWRVLYANALCRSGDRQAASVEYQRLKTGGFALPDDLNWMVSMAWLTEVCFAEKDQAGATSLYERLLPFADRLVVIGYAGIACLGSVQRYLALLSATAGHLEAAERHFREAIAVNRRVSANWPLAHSLCDLGMMLRDLGRPEAGEMIEEARSLARPRGLRAVESRTSSGGFL